MKLTWTIFEIWYNKYIIFEINQKVKGVDNQDESLGKSTDRQTDRQTDRHYKYAFFDEKFNKIDNRGHRSI